MYPGSTRVIMVHNLTINSSTRVRVLIESIIYNTADSTVTLAGICFLPCERNIEHIIPQYIRYYLL